MEAVGRRVERGAHHGDDASDVDTGCRGVADLWLGLSATALLQSQSKVG